MSENSTQAGDANTNESGFDNAMDDAIDSLLDNAVDNGTLSPAYDDEDVSTQDVEEDTEELEGEDDTEEDAANVNEEEEDTTDEDDEVEDEDDSTQDDEIDSEYDGLVEVKIDGEKSEITMEELIKGYQTSQSLTKKGQELAEQAKELENSQEDQSFIATVNANIINSQDQKDLGVLQALSKEIDAAVESDDTYELPKLQHKFQKAQEEYSERKRARDNVLTKQAEQLQAQYMENMGKKVEEFNSSITGVIPDWSEEVAIANRDFAIEAGIPQAVVDSITDPAIVKVLDEFRRLKQSASTGAKKRKKAAIKTVPAKKSASKTSKQAGKSDDARKRIKKGKGSNRDLKTLSDDVYDDIFGNSELF